MSSSSDRGTKRPRKTPELKPPERYATSEPTTKVCGCIETVFSDDTVDILPCVPHGLMQAANALLTAGNALGTVGKLLFNQEAAAKAMELANKEIEDGKADGSIS